MIQFDKYAISFGFKGKIYSDIQKFWNFLETKLNIKFMSNNHAPPHITVIAGEIKNIEKVFMILSKMKIKKFYLTSPGLGIFANNYPNLYIRWERSDSLMINSEKIRKKTSKYFKKLYQVSDNSFWVPKTTLAWKDLKYKNLGNIFKNLRFMFNKRTVLINYLYIIDFTNHEKIKYIIKLK